MAQSIYITKPHIVRDEGILRVKDTARIKVYTMLPEDEDNFSPRQVEAIKNHVNKDVLSGGLDPRLSLGFLIASEGVANLGIWGGEFPSLLNQSVYTFIHPASIDEGVQDIHKGPLESAGTMCCWEGAIFGHESAAWRRYLASTQSEPDKMKYLSDRFTGTIGID